MNTNRGKLLSTNKPDSNAFASFFNENNKPSILKTIKELSVNNHAVLWVTPEDARLLLKHNTENRSLRRQAVEFYAEEMRNNKWMDNGDPIRISKESKLLNGQHRLWAIIKSGVPIRLHFILDLDAASYQFMDNGITRTLSDNLYIPKQKAALFSALFQIYRSTTISRHKVGPTQARAMQTPEILRITEKLTTTTRKNLSSAWTRAAAIISILEGADEKEIISNISHITNLPPCLSTKEQAFNKWFTNISSARGFTSSTNFCKSLLFPATYKFYTTDFVLFKINEQQITDYLERARTVLTEHIDHYHGETIN